MTEQEKQSERYHHKEKGCQMVPYEMPLNLKRINYRYLSCQKCKIHNKVVCRCGWEWHWHYGTYSGPKKHD